MSFSNPCFKKQKEDEINDREYITRTKIQVDKYALKSYNLTHFAHEQNTIHVHFTFVSTPGWLDAKPPIE